MNTDLKARAEALLAALKVDGFRYIAGRPLDDLPWLKEALAAFMEAADAATVLALIRERDEARKGIGPDKVRRDVFDLQNRALLLMERRAEAAEAALSAAREEVERLRGALHKLETAASSMLVGVGVYNDPHVARGGPRIEGPVVTALVHATRNAGEVLKEPATLTKEPHHG